jgi:hypothetical protein
MNPQTLAAIASATVAIVGAIVGAAFRLSNSMSSLKEGLSTEISALKLEVAVLREREQQRGEKVEQMYQWWLKSIENGWIAHMKASAGS